MGLLYLYLYLYLYVYNSDTENTAHVCDKANM